MKLNLGSFLIPLLLTILIVLDWSGSVCMAIRSQRFNDISIVYYSTEVSQLRDILQVPQASSNDTLISDTLNLIKYGDENIVLLDEYKEVVLVVGNTGAGKSTLTKFLTGNNTQLISYATPGGYLIMDPEGDISNSTIVSQSLLPTLMIHNETNTAFYDMPGFSDTRNVSVEIANAFFMKKVADHVDKVKLLFVVNHFSLTPGMDRSDFIKMARQAIDYVKDIQKFETAITLISTKVMNPWNDTLVISGIVYFLETALYDLPALIPDENDRLMVTSLIHSFITQMTPNKKYTLPLVDTNDPFARIGVFRIPDREGPLSEIPIIMDSKPWMQEIIWNNTQFVEKVDEDFGLSLSADALFVVGEAVTKIQNELGDVMAQLRQVIVQEYQNQIGQMMTQGTLNSSYYLLDLLHVEYTTFVDMIPKLNDSSLTRTQFLDILETTLVSPVPPMTISDACRATLDEILELSKQLGFLELILEQSIPTPTVDWILSMASVKDSLGSELIKLITGKIRPEINEGLDTFSTSLNSALGQQFPVHFHMVSVLQALLLKDWKILDEVTTQLTSSSTLAQFSLTQFDSLKSLSVVITEQLPTLPSPNLHVDLDDLQPDLYPLGSWTKIFDTSMTLLSLRREFLTHQVKSEIQSPPVTNWGTWGGYADCDSGSMVSGMQLQVDHTHSKKVGTFDHLHYMTSTSGPQNVENVQNVSGEVGPGLDDDRPPGCQYYHEWNETPPPVHYGDMTGLNSIRFFCSNVGQSSDDKIKTISSKEGSKGEWGFEFKCSGLKKAIGFEVRTEAPRPQECWTVQHQCCWAWWEWMCNGCGWGDMGKYDCWKTTRCMNSDQTSVNNINLICEDQVILGGNGGDRGVWTGPQMCPAGQYLCGILTQVQDPGSVDGTGLNNLKAHCCNFLN